MNHLTSKWIGKTIVTFGDSITWYDGQSFGSSHSESGQITVGYQSYIRKHLGAVVKNEGVSGYTMPQISERVRSYDFSGVDAVTLTAGANDFRNIPTLLGTVRPIGSEFDNSTTIGALQSAIEYILDQNPIIRIYILTPIKGWNGSDVMPTAYPDSLKKVAECYALPVCDWYSESGINAITKSVYIGDDDTLPYKLHPTNSGFERMASILIPFLVTH